MRFSQNIALLALLGALPKQSRQATPVIDSQSPLVPMMDYIPPSDLDNDPNYFYPTDYRVLNCWDCFQAKGKVCIDQGHNSLFHHTGSSDPGNAFCCRPDSTHEYCQSGKIHDHKGIENSITTICSEPSISGTAGDHPDGKYLDILTGVRNYQMFAFCPHISHNVCGIPQADGSSGASHDMELKAGLEKRHVQSNEMRYQKPSIQNPDVSREYDACYYEVVLDKALLADYNPKFIHMQVSAKVEMNVYVYAGSSRFEATEPIIVGNEQAEVGTTYKIAPEKGFLIVAYPNKDQQTEFGFNYWLEAELKPDETEVKPEEIKEPEDNQQEQEVAGYEVVEVVQIEEPQMPLDTTGASQSSNQTQVEQTDETLFYILCIGAGFLMVAIIILCIKCRNQGKITHQTAGQVVTHIEYPQHTNENERSLQLEDMDYDKNEERKPSLMAHQAAANMFDHDTEKIHRKSYKQINAASSVMSGRLDDNGTEHND